VIKRSNILDAYVFLRKKNQDIPDEVLDFIKESSLNALDNTQDEAVRKALDKVNDAFSHLHGEEKITVGEVWDVVNNLKSQIGQDEQE